MASTAEFRKMESLEDDDSNENEANGDGKPPVVTVALVAKKFEALMLHISTGSLILAVILFIAQIIVVSTSWRLDASATVSGFGFIFFLVIIWFSIKKVYSDSLVQFGTLRPMGPTSFRFRLRGMLEISQKIPRKWIFLIGMLNLLGSVSLIACESFLLSIGIRWNWYLGTTNGIRIGLSVVFFLTSFSCFLLNWLPKRKWIHFICFILSFASLVCSCILVDAHQSLDVNRNFEKMYGEQVYGTPGFFRHLGLKNEDGKMFFPFFPWILLNIVMVTVPHALIVTSLAMIFICFNLWFSIKVKTNDEDKLERNVPSFAFVGVTLIFCGLVTDVAWQARYLTTNDYTYQFMGCGVFPTLTMFICGAFSLSLTTKKDHFLSKNLLFLASFALLSSQIASLIGTNDGLSSQKYEISEYGVDYNHRIARNSTHLCLTTEVVNPERCISMEHQVCNGVLDFITANDTVLKTNGYYPSGESVFLSDEDICGSTRFLPIYIALFACGGIGLFVTLTIWALTWKSVWQSLKMIFALFNQFVFSRIPMMATNEI